jgi:hypothetical protein
MVFLTAAPTAVASVFACVTPTTAWGFPELAKLSKEFLPQVECVYFIHNFKGSRPGERHSRAGCATAPSVVTNLTVLKP